MYRRTSHRSRTLRKKRNEGGGGGGAKLAGSCILLKFPKRATTGDTELLDRCTSIFVVFVTDGLH